MDKDDLELSEEFILGLQAGMMMAEPEPCERDDCPRSD